MAWKLKDSYFIGFIFYMIKIFLFYGIIFGLIGMIMGGYFENVIALAYAVFGLFCYFFGQFMLVAPVYVLFKDAGYPKIAKGFLYSGFIPLILMIVGAIWLYMIFDKGAILKEFNV
ncbi:MAG TPA: hypothetical protein VNW99_06830 [Cytophagaceae bacterium]|nr:hypothetical protein [Cytophagaceae bacterium]